LWPEINDGTLKAIGRNKEVVSKLGPWRGHLARVAGFETASKGE
jgi:hypothetical protein